MRFGNTTLKKMEGLQLLNYKMGQQFKPHHDYFDIDHIASEKGQRYFSHIL